MTEITLPAPDGGYRPKTIHEFNSAQDLIQHYDRIRNKFGLVKSVPQKPQWVMIRDVSPPVIIPVVEIKSVDNPPRPERRNIPVNIHNILQSVCLYYGVKRADLEGPLRLPAMVLPRHVLFYIARQLTTYSYPQIGRYCGKRDHTTVLHACQKISRLMPVNTDICYDVAMLLREFESLGGGKTQKG